MIILNEQGWTLNEKGNILCLKSGTRKQQYLSPLAVKNPEWMREHGWEVIIKPESPPRSNGKSNYSMNSYDEQKNQSGIPEDELLKAIGGKKDDHVSKITLKEFEDKIDSTQGEEKQQFVIDTYKALGFPVKEGANYLGNMYDEIIKKLTPGSAPSDSNESASKDNSEEIKIPKKRGRKPGTIIKKSKVKA